MWPSILRPSRLKKAPRRRDLAIESLERRELMAADVSASYDAASRVLTVEGTKFADTIQVSTIAGQVSINDTSIKLANGQLVDSLQAAKINRVVVRSLGGDDRIVMNEDPAGPLKVVKLYAYGGNGNDTLIGGSGPDRLYGQNGTDMLQGRGGVDLLDGGAHGDVLSGGDGDDRMAGGEGDDDLFGGEGVDVLTGGLGNDQIYGMGGDDTAEGNAGNDLLSDSPQFAKQLVGDFNGDGRDDVTGYENQGGRWLTSLSTGDGFATEPWNAYGTLNGWSSHLAGDFNGDGVDDIASFHGSNSTWWVGTSNGEAFTSTLWADFPVDYGFSAQQVGDYNGDGMDDVAQFRTDDGTWSVSLSTGSGFTTSVWADFYTNSGWTSQITGDFNGDGRDDIANFHPVNGTWWTSLSTGAGFDTTLWSDFGTNSGWSSQSVGDFNGDGFDDIANFYAGTVASGGQWWVSASTGAAFSTGLAVDFYTNTGWTTQLAGDFNGDGFDDLTSFHPMNGTWWTSVGGLAGFEAQLWADFATNDGWTAQLAGDFDGDGRDDVLNYHPLNSSFWVSQSTGASFATNLWELMGDGIDTYYGGDNDDQLFGYAGDDVLIGEFGKDSILGGLGNDVLIGGYGGLAADESTDNLIGEEGDDVLWGDEGDDFMYGGYGADQLHGGTGADYMAGEYGNDRLWGDEDADAIFGGFPGTIDMGDDELDGGTGDDRLYGGAGNDKLAGGLGTDYLSGEEGNDRLFGGWGDAVDTLFGGAGYDRFLQPRYEITLTVIDEDAIKDHAFGDARIYFDRTEKFWTDDEILQVDVGLDWLHNLTGKTNLLHMPDGKELTLGRVGWIQGALADNIGNGTMRITDSAFTSTIDLDESIVHEIGHNWDNEGFDALFFASLSDWKWVNITSGVPAGYTQANKFGVPQQEVFGTQTWAYIYKSDAQFARTDGYGKTNPREDFATCLETYYALTKPGSGANPPANWQAKWNYMNDWAIRQRG